MITLDPVRDGGREREGSGEGSSRGGTCTLCCMCVCVAIDVDIMLCAFAEWRVFADVVTRPNFGQFSNRMSELFRLA